MAPNRYRLVTRSDFDGLVCGMLLKELDLIDEITFVHPKDMQDGKIEITDRDITTNLPYVEGCHLAFDHHSSEMLRLTGDRDKRVIDPKAASAARVVYDYYGGAERFPNIRADLMTAVDKADSADFTRMEIVNPTGWTLLNFLMDSRTGLGRFRDFRISNYQLMMQLIDHCRSFSAEEVLALPDVKERVDLYFAHDERFKAQLLNRSEVHGPLVVLDLRQEETIFAGNRFMIYALHPSCNISMHVLWGLKQQNTVFAIGKSILDRSSSVNVGELCLGYGGGGHEAAGTCQVPNEQAESVKAELIGALSASGNGLAEEPGRLSA
ncbi:MAG: exopolyphosphatase [Fulvimarina manganoxydans]|uniref:exopolyphosphatase n=1 Tax=Fulvimarina manganoxydans TaxID=937218 RepID=UPI002357E1EC|nr:exopolyphosphatase [Fulvimarina manganoxydans]MCK5934192.1 exopolyphosphatase [Fulvimarina manganoxydans]